MRQTTLTAHKGWDVVQHAFCQSLSKCKNVIRYAKTADNQLLTADEYDTSTTFTEIVCLLCKKEMRYRQSHFRSINGISVPVRAHFFHISLSDCNASHETYEHAAAKQIIATYAHIQVTPFFLPCCTCNTEIPINIQFGLPDYMCVAERVIGDKSYRVDLALIHAPSDQVQGVIEIFQTHAVSDDKIAFFAEIGVPWVEIQARTVIEAWKSQNFRVCVLRCATNQCVACLDKMASSQANLRELLFKQQQLRVSLQKKHEDLAKLEQTTRLAIQELESNLESIEAKQAQRALEQYQQLCILDEKYTKTTPTHRLHAGKYRNHLIHSVWDIDKPYVRWIAGYTGWLDADNKPALLSRNLETHQWLCPEYVSEARYLFHRYLICLGCYGKCTESWQHLCRKCFQLSTN
jgi:hypothetical protein